ncbi:choice-of-anchor D domain-containing protein [Wenyingzhuangia sp. IMCC45467]
MKKAIQLLLFFTFIFFNSCGSDDTDENIESTISINTSTSSMSFIDTEVNTSSTLTFNITNTGNTSINNASITNTNTVFSINPKTFSISENQSKTFTITFTPSQSQNYTDVFVLKFGETTLANVNVSGNGIISTPVTSINSSTSTLNFNDVTLNNSKQLTFTITNNGNQNINSITLDNNSNTFVTNPSTFSLSVGATKTINVNFTPTQQQSYNDIINVTVAASTMASISLTGNGVESVPTTYNNHIKSIMTGNCTNCHGNNGGVNVETYLQTKDAFTNHGALQEIESGRMPQGASKLSQAKIDLIKKWIADGYPE